MQRDEEDEPRRDDQCRKDDRIKIVRDRSQDNIRLSRVSGIDTVELERVYKELRIDIGQDHNGDRAKRHLGKPDRRMFLPYDVTTCEVYRKQQYRCQRYPQPLLHPARHKRRKEEQHYGCKYIHKVNYQYRPYLTHTSLLTIS